jgi:hypothetical protein
MLNEQKNYMRDRSNQKYVKQSQKYAQMQAEPEFDQYQHLIPKPKPPVELPEIPPLPSFMLPGSMPLTTTLPIKT